MAKVLNKNPDVVSWWVGEGIKRRLEDEGFAKELDQLDKKLAAELAKKDKPTNQDSNHATSQLPNAWHRKALKRLSRRPGFNYCLQGITIVSPAEDGPMIQGAMPW